MLTKLDYLAFYYHFIYVSYPMQCFLRQQDFVNSWHPANLKFLETKLNSFWWFFDIWLKKVFRKYWTFTRKISSKLFFATTNFRYYSCPTDYENFFKNNSSAAKKRYQSSENGNIRTSRFLFHLLLSTKKIIFNV